MILIVIIVSVLWLLAGGYSAATALGIVAVTAHLAANVATQLGHRHPTPQRGVT